ncbi:MAG: DNA polymerase [Chloroflexota bacterium]|nr:DNA polymerase [Chloroflexota bacterium]
MDDRHSSPSSIPVRDTAELLYGHDPLPGIVAVERFGNDGVRLYRRSDGTVSVAEAPFRPWLLAERAERWRVHHAAPDITELAGEHALRYLVEFADWPRYLDAVQLAQDAGDRIFRLRSPVEQYLVRSGRTLFKDMVFADPKRLQIDIETTGLDAHDPESRVIVVAIKASEGVEELLLLEHDEAELLARVTERLRALDPDVIEGHNLFNFDLPFLVTRADRFGVSLRWGRDGSPLRIGAGTSRFKAGALTMPYTPAYIHGRHIVDTYQQIQRYDIGGHLSSYGLKQAVEELGLTRPDREFVPGPQIADVWRHDRDRLLRYALDDVRDVEVLSSLATPTEFYQTQILPRSFQAVATGGPGEKLNDLMLRAYLMHGHSIPTAQPSRGYAGGHAELLETGVFRPVVKCDVESLYPSIMLAEGITSSRDTLGAYLPMLADLTRRRLDAKGESRRATKTGQEAERAMWEGMQGSFKVLINSFYGYLGYGGGLFNDYDAAERVTLAGQRIVKQVVENLHAHGATPIEVDTDGVYFVPPADVDVLGAEELFITEVASDLPPGIRLSHDGRYAGMLSLRLKTYALLDHDGGMVLKGSALRSRRMEPFLRQFLVDAARRFLRDERDAVRDDYFQLAERIRGRDLKPAEIVQWGMINDQTLAKFPRLQRLIARLANPALGRSGGRLEFYERQDGELGLTEDWDHDENTTYLLRRLRDVAERFRALFTSDSEFDAFFPAISTRTDLVAARSQEAAQQLDLFAV